MSIANSGHDENGRYHGGKAGDQTGSEWQVRTWYDRPWDGILRHPDRKVAEDIARLARNAANNDRIGYDQYQRRTFWDVLKNADNYDPANIRTACESDCSAGVLAVCKAVGYRQNIDGLKKINPDGYTGNERAILKAAGFTWLTDSKYRKSDAYLLPGDVLLNEAHHTAINLTAGAKVAKPSAAKSTGLYATAVDHLTVRTGPGTNYRAKAKGELTTDGKVHAYGNGQLRQGTRVTVKKLEKDADGNWWGEIPSGWVCVEYQGKAYAAPV